MTRTVLAFIGGLYLVAMLFPAPEPHGTVPSVDEVTITLSCPRAYKVECEAIAADARRQVELMLGPIGP